MDWFRRFFSSGTLILKPEQGSKIVGFPHELAFPAKGETVGEIMDRFNTYRGPEQQILQVWTEDGAPLPFSTIVSGRLVAIVRGV
jgi:hypothetical protein